MNPHEILDYFNDRQAEMLRSIFEIVDIESPSNDAGQSAVVANWVEAALRDTGAEFEIERKHADGCGVHLMIRAFGSDKKPTLLLGHTDTVHPIGTNKQNPTRIEEDNFYGCGIFDMKANIVLMLEALRFFAITGTKPNRPITVFLSCDEEVGSHSGRPILESVASMAAECLVFEPSANGMVKTGRKGTGMFTLRAHGIPAHAGLEPEKGANAIVEIARQIEQIHSIAKPEIGTTVNVCTIKGGTTSNVIPEYAECDIDVRFSLMTEADRVDTAIRSLTPFDSRVSLELLGAINRPPLERTDAVVGIYEKAKALAAGFGYELGETQVGGASDGNFVAALGVPVLDGLGIAGAGAHTLDEHILVSDVANRATLITLLLA